MKSPMPLLSALFQDMERLEPGVKGLNRDLLTIEKRFENEGYGFLSVALPSLCAALDKGLATGQFASPIGFKNLKGQVIPRFLSGMLGEVFDPLTGHIKANPNTGVIKNMRMLLLCFKKVAMHEDQNENLDRKAICGFFQNDELAGQVVFPDTMAHFLGVVCKKLMPTLSLKAFGSADYKHGPGAVFEGYRGNQKWTALAEAVKSYDFDLETYGYGDFESGMTPLSDREVILSPVSQEYLKDGVSGCTARLVTVPKNSTSRRTITIEPLLNQFIQQGLNSLLRESILECKVLRNCLTLTDQRLNQKLALEGSITDKWATLDLKSASDLMSCKLVELVFGSHPRFLEKMMGCRSPMIVSRDSAKYLRKFAGMGNALTFPVQSICFAAICIAAILHEDGRIPSDWALMRASRRVRVFGDDIIVDTRNVHQCVKWLTAFGLIVNSDKSFLSGNFKESCGVDAYAGVDVTPLYVRHRPDDSSTEPGTIAGLVATANLLWMSCYYEASACLVQEVESRIRRRLPLTRITSGVLGLHTRLDATEPHRWNSELQRLETRAFALTPLKRRDRLDGYGALLKYFHTPQSRDAKDLLAYLDDIVSRQDGHLEKSPIRFKSRLVGRWVAA